MAIAFVGTRRATTFGVVFALCIAIGLVGGIVRVLVERSRGGLSGEVEPFPWSASLPPGRIALVVLMTVALAGGMAMSRGASPAVTLAFTAIPVVGVAAWAVHRMQSRP